MTRGQSQNGNKDKTNLPQTPKTQKSDGRDIEFSQELADVEDLEAQERSKAADARTHNKE
ncbi:YfhD family protein [Bacillaceae bacterium S4-13-58]